MAVLPDFHLLRTSLTSDNLFAQLRGVPRPALPRLVMRWVRGPDGRLAASWATEDAGATSIAPE